MNPIPPIFNQLLNWIMPLLVPILLLLIGVRILMSPLFLEVEYRTPNFPDDSYGFSQEDRLMWAPYVWDYVLKPNNISYLGDLEFEDGSEVFNDRELKHMVDVKVLAGWGLGALYTGLAIFLGLGIWAWRGGWWGNYRLMLANGGKITVVVLSLLIAYMLVNFNQIFVGFHALFFTGDTWLFLFSDTLIRLFPIRFWQDVFIMVGLFTFGSGAGLWYFLGKSVLPVVADVDLE